MNGEYDERMQDGSQDLGLHHSVGGRRGTFSIELSLDSKNNELSTG